MLVPPSGPNRAIAFIVLAPILFWVISIFVPAAIMRDVFNAFAFAVAFWITITWWSATWESIKKGAPSGEWVLIFAIWLTWCVTVLVRAYSILFNYMDRPDSWAESAITAFWPYSYFIAGLMFLWAPGEYRREFPIRSSWVLIAALATGIFVAGILLGYNLQSVV